MSMDEAFLLVYANIFYFSYFCILTYQVIEPIKIYTNDNTIKLNKNQVHQNDQKSIYDL
jgi:hypothetical protein